MTSITQSNVTFQQRHLIESGSAALNPDELPSALSATSQRKHSNDETTFISHTCSRFGAGAWETAGASVAGGEESAARRPQADGARAAAGEELPGGVPELPDGGSMVDKTKPWRPV